MRTFAMSVLTLISLCAVSASAQTISSQYTDLNKSCKVIETDIEFSLRRCPGVAGYKIEVADADARESVTVITPDGNKHQLNFRNPSGNFSSVGAKAEWRIKNQNGKTVPIALIIRFTLQDHPEDATKQTSYLTVTKITAHQVCTVDQIKPVANQNVKARKVADAAASMTCLSEN